MVNWLEIEISIQRKLDADFCFGDFNHNFALKLSTTISLK